PLTTRYSDLRGSGVLPVGADTARAGRHPRRLATHQHDGLLNVRPERSIRLSVRVADVVAKRHLLATDLATALHDLTLWYALGPWRHRGPGHHSPRHSSAEPGALQETAPPPTTPSTEPSIGFRRPRLGPGIAFWSGAERCSWTAR